MITDPHVFEPDYRPQQILHRDAEQQQLAQPLNPALDGDRAADVLLSGSHGVGKTALVHHLLNRLDQQAGIAYATVQCLGKTTAGIVRATLQELGADPAGNTPEHDLCLQLRDRVTEPTIVVLDEADDVPATDALTRLWDIDLVSVVAICHDPERWLSRLELSSDYLHRPGVELELERYAPDELADILAPRARKGLDRNVVDREQLRAIADRAAGNAREAILTLHASATVAHERGRAAIADTDIPDGHDRARRWGREEALSSLAFHHHVLYEVIRGAGVIGSGALHDRYEAYSDCYQERSLTPLGKRARRHKLTKLEEYDLITFDGDNQYGKYRAVDPDVQSKLVQFDTQMVSME